MKLYEVTIVATVDDLETLAVSLSAEVVLDDPSLQPVVTSVLPAHLRKVADDLEAS